MRKYIFWTWALFISLICLVPDMANAAAREHGINKEKALTGDAWTFGQSLGRNDAIWHKGINFNDVKARATRNVPKVPKQAADTRKGIDRAIENTREKNFPGGVSMETQKSSWKVNPTEKFMRPDEEKVRESRHVVRAFADVAPSDNLDINIGPELILKDENSRDQIANSSQPDTVLGLGMNFKLDF